MTLYLFLFLFFINLSWYRITIEDYCIHIKWLDIVDSQIIPIKDIIAVEKIMIYLQGKRTHGYGNTFVWYAIKIKYNKSFKEHIIEFVPDNCDLFIKQISMAIKDNNIKGYLLPSPIKKVIMLVIIFTLISTLCYFISDFNHATLIGASYSILALIIYNICKKVIYKEIIYTDYYNNLEKYAIRS